MTRAGSGVLGKALLSPDPYARSRIAYRSPALRQRLAVGLLRAALRNHRLLSGRRATLSRLVRDPRARNRQELDGLRSEEHTSELQSLMRISYAVFCLKKKKKIPETKYYQSYTA